MLGGESGVDERLRAEVISALDFVSGVTLFDEVSVLELVEEILPDVLVKGGLCMV